MSSHRNEQDPKTNRTASPQVGAKRLGAKVYLLKVQPILKLRTCSWQQLKSPHGTCHKIVPAVSFQIPLDKKRGRPVARTFIMYLPLPVPQDVIVTEPNGCTETEDDPSCVCPSDLSLRERRQKDKDERLSLVLWRRPLVTLHYFLLETLIKLKEWTLE